VFGLSLNITASILIILLLLQLPLPLLLLDMRCPHVCRYVFAVKLAPGQQLRRVLPAAEADVERLIRYLADSE
jgi:hypothetical protein